MIRGMPAADHVNMSPVNFGGLLVKDLQGFVFGACLIIGCLDRRQWYGMILVPDQKKDRCLELFDVFFIIGITPAVQGFLT